MGKTTLAAALALGTAARRRAGGRPVLVVSTDPAHSLGDALLPESEPALGGEPRRVPGAGGALLAAELAARPAWERWLAPRREALRALAERGSLLDAEDVARLLGLPLPGVDELVALLELVRLAEESGCARVVVDTAPTAHTLRLLRMPAALERFAAVLAALQERHRAVAEALVGRAGRLPEDAADAVAAGIAAEARALGELVRDPRRCAFTWVLLPEALSLAETRDALAELEAAGATVDELVVNRVTPPPPEPCATCARRRRAEAEVVGEVRALLGRRRLRPVPELEREPRGAAALRRLGRLLAEGWDPCWDPGREADGEPEPEPDREETGGPRAEASSAPTRGIGSSAPTGCSGGARLLPERGRRDAAEPPAWRDAAEPLAWLDAVAPRGVRLLLFGGKGGVGKTTCAAAAALAAARDRPERPVLLLSTDPAHSVADVLDAPLGDEARPVPGAAENLRARELDSAAAFAGRKQRYREALERAFSAVRPGGAGFDVPFDREVLERLLEATPPGLDELVAVGELIDALAQEPPQAAGGPLLVVDTAPTGHALRLLEMPELALEWDHALLALLLKYREAVGLPADWAEELLALARSLKRLRALLADPGRCRFVAVTRAGELPRRETRRLLAALGRLGIAAPAVVINAFPEGECRRCRRAARAGREQVERLRAAAGAEEGSTTLWIAPAEYPPPRGARALERWGRHWRPEPR